MAGVALFEGLEVAVVLIEITKVISGTIKVHYKIKYMIHSHGGDDVGIVLTIPKHLIIKLSDK